VRLTLLPHVERALLERTGKRPVSIGEMLNALGESGSAALIILVASPFMLAIPPPGL